MQDSEMHSILFRGIIARLNSLTGEDGGNIHDGRDGENPLGLEFYIAYQQRPTERFAHNYERDKFLHHRDKYSMMNKDGSAYVLVDVKQGDYATIYSKPIKLAFGREGERAVEMLERLMHKFYDKVTIEEISPIRLADYSQSGSNARDIRVQNELR